MAKLKLSPPWIAYYHEINELFRKDPSVNVTYDEDAMAINLYVTDPVKADALAQILPTEKNFGSISLKINVIPANDVPGWPITYAHFSSIYEAALSGNDAFSYLRMVPWDENKSFTYIVFVREVVQYFNDDISDLFGAVSTLYEDLARDVFIDKEGVYFCTDIYNNYRRKMPEQSACYGGY